MHTESELGTWACWMKWHAQLTHRHCCCFDTVRPTAAQCRRIAHFLLWTTADTFYILRCGSQCFSSDIVYFIFLLIGLLVVFSYASSLSVMFKPESNYVCAHILDQYSQFWFRLTNVKCIFRLWWWSHPCKIVGFGLKPCCIYMHPTLCVWDGMNIIRVTSTPAITITFLQLQMVFIPNQLEIQSTPEQIMKVLGVSMV